MKETPEEWAERMLKGVNSCNSGEDFINLALFGMHKPFTEYSGVITTENLTVDEIIKRYDLTDEEINKLRGL